MPWNRREPLADHGGSPRAPESDDGFANVLRELSPRAVVDRQSNPPRRRRSGDVHGPRGRARLLTRVETARRARTSPATARTSRTPPASPCGQPVGATPAKCGACHLIPPSQHTASKSCNDSNCHGSEMAAQRAGHPLDLALRSRPPHRWHHRALTAPHDSLREGVAPGADLRLRLVPLSVGCAGACACRSVRHFGLVRRVARRAVLVSRHRMDAGSGPPAWHVVHAGGVGIPAGPCARGPGRAYS